MVSPVLAVIGGSGMYEAFDLEDVRELQVDTPFGPPSDAIVKGRLGGNGVPCFCLGTDVDTSSRLTARELSCERTAR